MTCSPFNEAECGHHYARAMASWAAVLAWTGFHYSAVKGRIAWAARPGRHFWSTGAAWGDVVIASRGRGQFDVALAVFEGAIGLREVVVGDRKPALVAPARTLAAGERLTLQVSPHPRSDPPAEQR